MEDTKRSRESVSRRDFLKTTAILGAGTAAAGVIAGCSRNAGAADNIAWDKEVDVLVVGSGTAVYGALAAKDAGSSVLIIEKNSHFGGTTSYSGGAHWVPMNPYQVTKWGADSRDDAIKYIMAIAEGQSTKEVITTFVDAGADFCTFSEKKLGIVWNAIDYVADYYQAPGQKMSGRSLMADAKALGITGDVGFQSVAGAQWKWLRKKCDEFGVEVMTETEAKKLLTNSAGEVIGVTATNAGKSINIHAKKGVLLATGGFDYNLNWCQRFLRAPIYNTVAIDTNTGDGHRMGLELDADLIGMGYIVGAPSMLNSVESARAQRKSNVDIIDMWLWRAFPNGVVVNKHGVRFGNEDSAYSIFNRAWEGYDTDHCDGEPNFPAWLVVDSTWAKYYSPTQQFLATAGKIPDYALKANTLQELAQKMGVPVDVFLAEIAEFNANAKLGKDPKFNRGAHLFDQVSTGDTTGRKDLANRSLGPVETGPFYAMLYGPGSFGTTGGLLTNGDGQVVKKDGSLIPRLYATGTCGTFVCGAGYGSGGASVGGGSVMGYAVAKKIAALTPLS